MDALLGKLWNSLSGFQIRGQSIKFLGQFLVLIDQDLSVGNQLLLFFLHRKLRSLFLLELDRQVFELGLCIPQAGTQCRQRVVEFDPQVF